MIDITSPIPKVPDTETQKPNTVSTMGTLGAYTTTTKEEPKSTTPIPSISTIPTAANNQESSMSTIVPKIEKENEEEIKPLERRANSTNFDAGASCKNRKPTGSESKRENREKGRKRVVLVDSLAEKTKTRMEEGKKRSKKGQNYKNLKNKQMAKSQGNRKEVRKRHRHKKKIM